MSKKVAPKQLQPTTNKLDLYFKIILLVFAFVLYGNTLKNKYSLDDLYVTCKNEQVRGGIKALPEIFASRYVSINDDSNNVSEFGYRPVTKASFAIEYAFFKENPGVSHFFNVLLYALSLLLLYNLLRRWLKNYSPWFVFLIVALFAAHPIHTEVVASLKNREEIFAFFFGILSLSAFHKSTEKNAVTWTVLGISFLILSLISKFSFITFIVILPLSLYFFSGAKPSRILALSAIVVGVYLIGFLIFKYNLPPSARTPVFYDTPLKFVDSIWVRWGTAFYALLYYLKLLLLPHPLGFYYGYNMIPLVNFSNLWVILSVIIHLALLVFALLKLKEKQVLSFAILFYLLAISAFSGFLGNPPGIIAERFLYIPSLGFCIVLAWVLFRILKTDGSKTVSTNQGLRVLAVGLLILIPYSVKTIARNADWKTELTLFEADIDYLSQSAKAHKIYANELQNRLIANMRGGADKSILEKDAEKIVTQLEEAIKIYPDYQQAWNALGRIHLMFYQDYDKSIECYQKMLQLTPNDLASQTNLGYAYQQKGDFADAIRYYLPILKADSLNVQLASNLSVCYNKIDKLDSAVWVNQKIIEKNPSLELPYSNIVSFYFSKNDTINALPWLEKYADIAPDNKKFNGFLYRYFSIHGQADKAGKYQSRISQN